MLLNSVAYAAEGATPQGNPITGLLPIVAIFAIFYFLIIRPQSKRAKEEQKMRDALQIGNRVTTISGIFGTVTEIDNAKGLVSVSIAKDVAVTMYKSSIVSVLKKAEEEKKEEDKK